MTSCTELVMNDIESFYKLCPHPEDPEDVNQVCLQILEGPFTDTIIQFGRVKVKASDENPDELSAQYEYNIISIPDEIKDVEFSDEIGEEFESKVGDVMISLLQKSIEEKEKNNDTKNGNSDIFSFST